MTSLFVYYVIFTNQKVKKNINELIKQTTGLIKTSEPKLWCINNKELQRLINAIVLERVAFGLYISSDYFLDEYLITQYRCPKSVFSHEAALYFHDLSDRTSLKLTLTIPSGYSAKLLKEKGIS